MLMMNLFAQSRQDDDLFADEYDLLESNIDGVLPQPAKSSDPRSSIHPFPPQIPSANFIKRRPRKGQTPLENASDQVRFNAVRGDRSLTGGISKTRLTEDELSEKLEKMRIINAVMIEKHRLQAADQAAFEFQDEEITKELLRKEEKERAQRIEMEKERTRNRERKMKTIGRREWDFGKQDCYMVDHIQENSSSKNTKQKGFHQWLNNVMRDDQLNMQIPRMNPQLENNQRTEGNLAAHHLKLKSSKVNHHMSNGHRNSNWVDDSPIDKQQDIHRWVDDIHSGDLRKVETTGFNFPISQSPKKSDWVSDAFSDKQRDIHRWVNGVHTVDLIKVDSSKVDFSASKSSNSTHWVGEAPTDTQTVDSPKAESPKGDLPAGNHEPTSDSSEVDHPRTETPKSNNRKTEKSVDNTPLVDNLKDDNPPDNQPNNEDLKIYNEHDCYASDSLSIEPSQVNTPKKNNELWLSRWATGSPGDNQRNSMIPPPESKKLQRRENAYLGYTVFGADVKKPGEKAEVCVKIPASVLKLVNFKGND